MEQGYVRLADLSDVPLIVADLRPADRAELLAASPYPLGDTLRYGVTFGYCEAACLPDGSPVALWGTTPTQDPDLGLVWMVATNRFSSLHRQFLRGCRWGLQRVGHGYKALYNYTDARNTVHHRWLKWCGFTIIKEHPNFGVEGRPFYEFVRLMET